MRRSTSAFSSAAKGAEVQNFICSDERSVASNPGSASRRRYCTGTSMAWVTRWRSASASHLAVSNLGISTTVPPQARVGMKLTKVVLE